MSPALSPVGEELLRQLRELPVEEREAVAAALLEVSGMELSPELEAELDRREAAVASGESRAIPAEEVFAELKRRLTEPQPTRTVNV